MARAGITFEQVSAVADALLSAGHRPTIIRVREELGTGSASTIQRFLSEWNQSKPKVIASKPQELPPAIVAAFMNELAKASEQGKAGVLSDFEEAQQAVLVLTAEGETLGTDLKEAEEALAALRGAHQVAEAALQTALAENRVLAAEVETLRVAVDASRVDAARAEGRVTELDNRVKADAGSIKILTADNETLTADLTKTKADLATSRIEAARVEGRLVELEARNQADAKALQTARDEAKAAREATQAATIEAAELRGRLIVRTPPQKTTARAKDRA